MDTKGKSNMVVNAQNLEVVLTYIFDAPRDLVFKVYTDPALIPQWWGPRYLTTTVERLELRPGGAWRFIQRDPAGNVFAFNGVFREIVAPERLVYTFEYEAIPGHISVETVTFEDLNGKTLVTARDVFQSLADLEGMVQSGMEIGVNEGYERATELLQAMIKETNRAGR